MAGVLDYVIIWNNILYRKAEVLCHMTEVIYNVIGVILCYMIRGRY